MALPIIFDSPWVRWGWGVPILVLLWWLTRHLRQEPDEAREPRWIGRPLWFPLERLDRVSLGICAAIGVLFWIGRASINPYPPDSIYHLLVARRIYETGSVPMWCDWQFFPLGRPHLYPPLFHLALAGAAWLFHGDFLAGFRFVETIALPFVFFSTWYLARWLFDARRAFVALLIVGTDYSLVFTAAMGTPSVLATSLMSFAIVMFLSGRWHIAALLCVTMFYTHTGIPPIALGALGLFGLLHRRYLPDFLAVAVISLIAFVPWYARLYVFRDWFTHPLAEGVYGAIPPEWLPFYKIAWLQFVSFSVVIVVLRAFRGLRWGEARNQVLLIAIAACLPMLFSYGGRFYTHSIHLWAILAAGVFARYLCAPVRTKRILAFGLLALAPTVGIMGFGTPIPPGTYPMPSAWLIAPVVATRALDLINEAQPPGYVTWRQAEAVAQRVREVTVPGQPIYFQGDRDFALMIEWLADRPIDTGAWEETQPNRQARALIDWAASHNPNGCWVSRSNVGFPAEAEVEEVAGLYVGWRHADPTDARKLRRKLKRELRQQAHDSYEIDASAEPSE